VLFLRRLPAAGHLPALDSGPLEPGTSTSALAADDQRDIETGLSRSGVVLGVAIAGGALLGGGSSRSARSAGSPP
jgi:hypothetical protein